MKRLLLDNTIELNLVSGISTVIYLLSLLPSYS